MSDRAHKESNTQLEAARLAALKAEEDKILKQKADLEKEMKRLLDERTKNGGNQAELEKLKQEIANLEKQSQLPREAVTKLVTTNEKTSKVATAESNVQAVKKTSEHRDAKLAPTKQHTASDKQSEFNTSNVEFRDKNLKDFQSASMANISYPDADQRNFNVNDVIGDWDRDDKGNVIVVQDK